MKINNKKDYIVFPSRKRFMNYIKRHKIQDKDTFYFIVCPEEIIWESVSQYFYEG